MSEKQFEESSLNDYKRYGEPWDQILFLAADAYDMDLPLFMEMLAAGPDPELHPELAALADALPESGELPQAAAEVVASTTEEKAEQSMEAEPPMPRRRRLRFEELAAMFGQFPEKRMPGPGREGRAMAAEKRGERELARAEAPVLERK